MVVYLFLESEDALDECLHSVFFLLWIYDRGVLACSRLVALFLGYASATAVAAWANIILGAWTLLGAVIAVIAALLAVAVLWLLAWLGWLSVLLLCVLLPVALLRLLLLVEMLINLRILML